MKSENYAEYIIENSSRADAINKTTTLAVIAHQDDAEFMTYPAIKRCYGSDKEWFSAIVVTDGGGSPRSGKFKDFSDEEMKKIRSLEQKKAAKIGRYAHVSLLGYPSFMVKEKLNDSVTEDILKLINSYAPHTIYTHSLLDRHDTHIAVAVRTIKAIRMMDKSIRPKMLLGGEMWGSLDWLIDNDLIKEHISDDYSLAEKLMGVYKSQIGGGKRYDLAVTGRRIANATLRESHNTDTHRMSVYYLDLTPLIMDDTLEIDSFMLKFIDNFYNECKNKLSKF